MVKTTWSHGAPIPLPLRENSSLTSLLAIFVSISTAVIIKKHSSYDPPLWFRSYGELEPILCCHRAKSRACTPSKGPKSITELKQRRHLFIANLESPINACLQTHKNPQPVYKQQTWSNTIYYMQNILFFLSFFFLFLNMSWKLLYSYRQIHVQDTNVSLLYMLLFLTGKIKCIIQQKVWVLKVPFNQNIILLLWLSPNNSLSSWL